MALKAMQKVTKWRNWTLGSKFWGFPMVCPNIWRARPGLHRSSTITHNGP